MVILMNTSTNDIGFYVQVSSKNEYYIDVIRAKEQLDLTDLSFFLRDSGNTYVGGNGFGQIGMKM